MTLILLWVLRNYLMKSCTQAALGRDAYQKIFHRIKKKSESEGSGGQLSNNNFDFPAEGWQNPNELLNTACGQNVDINPYPALDVRTQV